MVFVKSCFLLCTLDKLLIYMNNAKAFTYGCFFFGKTRKYPNMIERKKSLAGRGGCGWIVNHMAMQPGSTVEPR